MSQQLLLSLYEGKTIDFQELDKDLFEVRIVEHLYRWTSWDIIKNSDPFKKVDSRTVEFLVQIPPYGEKTMTYKVHYSW